MNDASQYRAKKVISHIAFPLGILEIQQGYDSKTSTLRERIHSISIQFELQDNCFYLLKENKIVAVEQLFKFDIAHFIYRYHIQITLPRAFGYIFDQNIRKSCSSNTGFRPKTWKKQVEEETEKVGLKKDALNRAKCRRSASNCRRNGVNPAIFAKRQPRIKTE